MRLLTFLSSVYFGCTAFAQPPQAPPVRLDIVESRIYELEARVGNIESKVEVITATLARIEAKLAPAVQTPFTPAALSYVSSGDCPNGQCNAASRYTTRATTAPYVVAGSTFSPAGTQMGLTTIPVGSTAPYGVTSGGCGSAGTYGAAPRRGPVRRLFAGLFGGCGG